MIFPFAKEREWFPILKEQIQLSSCSQSAISIHVEAAIKEYMDSLRYGGMDWNLWLDRVEQAKASFARLIHAEPDEIAVFSSVSASASSLASTLSFNGERNKVVMTELDFPSIGHVWLAQETNGAKVSFIPNVNGIIPMDYYEREIDEQTLVTSISHVSFYNGFKQNLKEIAQIAHRKGSYLFVDAYQSAGSVDINVKDMDVDFLAAGAQKFLMGLPGISFLYIKKEIANQLQPKITGWFGRVNPFEFDPRKLDYADGTRRFETGTPPMINAYAAQAALEVILNIGTDKIEAYLQELSKVALNHAAERKLEVASPSNLEQKAANTAIRIPHAMKIEQLMKEKGFIVSARNDVIRIAPQFYNTKEEIVQAIDTLAELNRTISL